MREYARVSPAFWTGSTGRQLVADGPDAVSMSFYLLTSPHSNMLGLYYLPMAYICHDTGLSPEGACKALAKVCERGFATYDKGSNWVFVHKMAFWQVGERLKPTDNRVKHIRELYAQLPKNPFLSAFFDTYGDAYHLEHRRPSEGPLKPLRSQEQEQAQEKAQEQAQEQERDRADASLSAPTEPLIEQPPDPPPKPKPKAADKKPTQGAKSAATWEAYSAAYFERYGTEPVRNQKISAQLCQLVDRLGAEEAPLVAAYYVEHNHSWYIQKGHAVGVLLTDAEKLRTEWATRRRITSNSARDADRKQSNFEAAEEAKRLLTAAKGSNS